MLFTDTWDYHCRGCRRGNQTHRKYLGTWVTRSATRGPCLAVFFIANIHYATQTQWWVLKLNTKRWKFLKGGMPRMKRNKRHIWCIWNEILLIFFIKASIYWISTICSEDVCITPEHSPLWSSDFILHHNFRWSLVWEMVCHLISTRPLFKPTLPYSKSPLRPNGRNFSN